MNQSSIRPKSWQLEPGVGDDVFNDLFLNAERIYLLDRMADGSTLVSLIEGHCERRIMVDAGEEVSGSVMLRALQAPDTETTAARGDALQLSGRTIRRYMSRTDVERMIDDFIAREGHPSPELVVEATVVASRKGERLERDTTVTVPLPDFKVTTPPRPATAVSPRDRRNLRGWLEDSGNEGADDSADHTDGMGVPRSRHSRRRNGWVFVLLAVVALGVGYAAVRYLPGLIPEADPIASTESTDVSGVKPHDDGVPVHFVPDSAESDSVVAAAIPPDTATVMAPDTASVAAVQPSQAADEAADLQYLNAQRVWRRASLKSDRYRAFFDLFAAGSIKDIAEADYFAGEGVATNRDALRVADMLWSAYRTPTQRSNERELRKLVRNGEIDLSRIYDTLSRYRDAKPNKTPRPRR